jgi:hypothetical protein
LYGEEWLLAYEANFKGWLKTSTDYVKADPNFGYLKNNRVPFYDDNAPARTRRITKKLKRPVVYIHPYLDNDDF